MYVQQTISVNMLSMLVFLKTWCHFINTGNIGICKRHKKEHSGLVKKQPILPQKPTKGLGKRPPPHNVLVFSMAYLVTFIDGVVQLWKNVLFTYWEVENNLSCNMPTRILTYSNGIMYENTKIRLILSIPVQKNMVLLKTNWDYRSQCQFQTTNNQRRK